MLWIIYSRENNPSWIKLYTKDLWIIYSFLDLPNRSHNKTSPESGETFCDKPVSKPVNQDLEMYKLIFEALKRKQ